MARPSDYDIEGYSHFMRRDKIGSSIEVTRKDRGSYSIQDKEAVEIDFGQFETVDLNRKGATIPYTISNVVNVERYLIKYWSPIIGSDAIHLYIQLTELCRFKDGIDICYEKLSVLGYKIKKKDKRTVKKLLDILQDNNFIIYAYRYNERTRKEDCPIFKVRQTVPLLSKEQYLELSASDRKKHDEYMENFANGQMLEHFHYDAGETISELLENGDVRVSRKSRQKIKDAMESENRIDYIMGNISDKMSNTLIDESRLFELLESKGLSKPTRETYFADVITLYDDDVMLAYFIFPNSVKKDFAEENMTDGTRKAIQDIVEECYEPLCKIKFITAENFIIKRLKGRA